MCDTSYALASQEKPTETAVEDAASTEGEEKAGEATEPESEVAKKDDEASAGAEEVEEEESKSKDEGGKEE